jgi:hypothetical protein
MLAAAQQCHCMKKNHNNSNCLVSARKRFGSNFIYDMNLAPIYSTRVVASLLQSDSGKLSLVPLANRGRFGEARANLACSSPSCSSTLESLDFRRMSEGVQAKHLWSVSLAWVIFLYLRITSAL